MYSKIKLFRTLSSHLLALIVFGFSAQATMVTFYNPLQGDGGVSTDNYGIGDRIDQTTLHYQYGSEYGWTPNVYLDTANLNVYRDWIVNGKTDPDVTHNGALYKSGTSSTFVFRIIAENNYEVSLRDLEVAFYKSDQFADTVTLSYNINLSNDGQDFTVPGGMIDKTFSTIQTNTTNINNADNKLSWDSGIYRARGIEVVFSLDNIDVTGLRSSFGITNLGFEQIAVPEPSVYALILGGLALGWVALKRRIS